MTAEPKMYIDTEEELLELGKWWKERLLLQNWVIAFELLPARDMLDINWAGFSEVQWVNRCGMVSLLRKEDMPETLCKQPMEATLIHELLHFKFMSMDNENRSVEGVFWEEKQHQLLEDMAKALYMAKYGLDYGWFRNEG